MQTSHENDITIIADSIADLVLDNTTIYRSTQLAYVTQFVRKQQRHNHHPVKLKSMRQSRIHGISEKGAVYRIVYYRIVSNRIIYDLKQKLYSKKLFLTNNDV